MHYYGTAAKNQSGHLEIGGVDTVDLAREFGTPLYVMDEAVLRQNCRAYVGAFRKHYPNFAVAYASKAFLCTAMAALVDQESMSLDVVSGGEIATALNAGFPMERTYFHGNNKTVAEIELALKVGVGRIVVDSVHELELLNRMSGSLGYVPKIFLRLTPGVGAHGHHYVSTGQLDSKFGIPIETGDAFEATKQALSLPHVELKGFHCHIGSQIHDMGGYKIAAQRMLRFVADVKEQLGFDARELNLGGGLGVRYTEEDTTKTPEALVSFMTQTVKRCCAEYGLELPKLIIEPGRSIVGEAGTTLYTIGTVKEIPGIRTYISIDGGMGDNIRPALYQAVYESTVANKMDVPEEKVVTVAGRFCESGDMLLHDVKVANTVDTGDILAVFTTGAYNYSMASHYNRYPKPAVVFVADGKAELVVRRESFEDMAAFDLVPEHLRAAKGSK
ncbi:MAG TPA: diaminopimelate decarboxylase [Symbiobacteriaceae bacterium]|nr:diaminopimelate decarboxylase [Symbiobacteriaceae bacterium]